MFPFYMSISGLLLFTLKAATTTDCDVVFTEQPGPVLAPIGPRVQLRCTVVQEYGVRWLITPSDGSPISTAESDSVVILRSLGISVEPISLTAQESVLTVNGTEGNNGTTVVCVAALLTDSTMRCPSEEVQIIFYGPPSAPADLAATENGIGSLTISWSLVTIEGVAVAFTVTVTNLNDSSTGPMEVSGIQDQHYIFTIEDSTSCDVYSFQVTAVNGAGTGTPSEITRSLPSLPDISPVQDSLQHSLVRTASGVTLSVTFIGATSCPDYPVTSHTLVLLEVSSGGMEMISLEETSDGAFMLEERELEENSQYSFHVVVTNDLGTIQSTPVQIITTNVQDIIISNEEDVYSIQCIYLSGSNISGCVYVLVSGEEGVENVTGFIEREENVEVSNIGCYSEVLAYENSTGVLPVRMSISDTCNGGPTLNLTVILVPLVLAVILVILLVVTLIILAVIKLLKRKPNDVVHWNKKSQHSEAGPIERSLTLPSNIKL